MHIFVAMILRVTASLRVSHSSRYNRRKADDSHHCTAKVTCLESELENGPDHNDGTDRRRDAHLTGKAIMYGDQGALATDTIMVSYSVDPSYRASLCLGAF